MRLAVLDIGSNTAHLVVVDGGAGGTFKQIAKHKETLRLAEAAFPSMVLPDEAIDRLVATVDVMRQTAHDEGAATITAFATSAMREATNGMEALAQVRDRAGVPVAALDVGGGFPAAYVGIAPPPLEAFVAEIRAAMADHGFGPEVRLACEPGRALVAEGMSVVVRVTLRKGDALYINDGVYGTLSELRMPGIRFPVRLLRSGAGIEGQAADFRLFGPTCDPIDEMVGPFALPDDVAEGDWIEIGQCGAYSTALSTRFNGFGRGRFVALADEPLRPIYREGLREAA